MLPHTIRNSINYIYNKPSIPNITPLDPCEYMRHCYQTATYFHDKIVLHDLLINYCNEPQDPYFNTMKK